MVIAEYVQRIFAGMEAAFTGFCFWFFVFFAYLELVVSAFEVFVKAFE